MTSLQGDTTTQTTGLEGDTIRKEPVLIIDTTGSMTEPAAPGSTYTKSSLATDVARTLVTVLAGADTQGADEQGGGGLLTISFADGIATEVGDLNPGNFDTLWSKKIRWRGGTYITPAFTMMMENFQEEFGALPTAVQPQLIAAVLTDGELSDTSAANSFLRSVHGNVYVYVVVVGYGTEHDKAVASWQNIAETNPHVKVEPLTGTTDARGIADRILAMVQ